jgi:hypothetical protein
VTVGRAPIRALRSNAETHRANGAGPRTGVSLRASNTRGNPGAKSGVVQHGLWAAFKAQRELKAREPAQRPLHVSL